MEMPGAVASRVTAQEQNEGKRIIAGIAGEVGNVGNVHDVP
jgi:hypothetical protein